VTTDPSEDAAKVAGIFGYLADRDFHGYSPLYEQLARQIAHDDAIPALVTKGCRQRHAPVLFFACVHDIVLREPGSELAGIYRASVNGSDSTPTEAWEVFRAFTLDHADELDELLRTRQIQTNEVGRSAALIPALSVVAQRFDQPLALIEIGTSAGLNLLFDRYHIDYDPVGAVGPTDSPVRLRCAVRGTRRPPVLDGAPELVWRVGIDRSPVDVRDADATRWLRACIWPDTSGRADRFEAAVALARTDPPELWEGDALGLIEEAVAAVPDGAVPCLLSTWVLAYLNGRERAELHRLVGAIGHRRRLAYATAEYEVMVPWLSPASRRPAITGGELPTRLGLGLWDCGPVEERSLGWMHAHASWLEWLDDASAA
jgi:hypothetical protein